MFVRCAELRSMFWLREFGVVQCIIVVVMRMRAEFGRVNQKIGGGWMEISPKGFSKKRSAKRSGKELNNK